MLIVNECKRARCTDSKGAVKWNRKILTVLHYAWSDLIHNSLAISDTSNVHTFTFLHLHVIIVALDTTLQRFCSFLFSTQYFLLIYTNGDLRHSQRRTYRDRTINRVWQGDRQTMDIWRI
ncbi:hypothetical protein Plhal304r1_c028g0093121 [Plasmopara halstedii]